jgi:hypothetical protein
MIADEGELKVTILRTRQKLRDIVRKGSNLSNEGIRDVCTLNLLLDSAIKSLKELQDDKK